MKGLNKVILLGIVGKEPESRAMPNGNSVASFSLATSETWKDKSTGAKKESTEWHKCIAFGKLAEIANNYIEKGSKLYCEGKIKTHSWEKDGIKRYTTEVIVDDIIFLQSKEIVKTESKEIAKTESEEPDFNDDIPF